MRVVVDWDGTVTETDGLHLVLLEFGDEQIYDAAESKLGRELTLNEVIALEFESVRAPLPRSWTGCARTCACGPGSRSSRARTTRSSSRAASTS